MIHSPFGTLSPPKAFGASARIDNKRTRASRFIEFRGSSIYAGNENLQAVAAIDLNCHGGSVNRLYLDFIANQVLPSLAFADQRDAIAAHQRFCRQRA